MSADFQDENKIVYVVSFAPSFTGWHGDNVRVGGFEWRNTWEDAVAALQAQLEDGDTGHDYTLRAFPVPKHLDRDGVTHYLSDNAELRDLPIPADWMREL